MKLVQASSRRYVEQDDPAWYEELHIEEKFLYLYHEESYLAHQYFLKLHGDQQGQSLAMYHDFLRKDIIVVDEHDMLMYWNKGLHSRVQVGLADQIEDRLGHSMWQRLYLEGLYERH